MRTVRLSIHALKVGVLLAVVTVAPAMAGDLPGNEIRKAVSGKTVYVSTAVGSMPIKFRPNGTMRARAPVIASFTGPRSDSGRWWVSGQRLCQKWNKWLKGKTQCVTLRRSGKKYVWTGTSGRSGVARVSSAR